MQRTGGGGRVLHSRSFTMTRPADVTATVNTPVPRVISGVIRLQFFITIHGDVDRELNETFVIGLSNP